MVRNIISYTILLFTVLSLAITSWGAELEQNKVLPPTNQEVKINSTVFDNADSALFLITNSSKSDDISVKAVKLDDNRIYFDITNAALSHPSKTWELQHSGIEKIKLSQFSTKPDVVRIVFHYKSDFDPDYIRVQKLGEVIAFKYNHDDISGDYFMNIYRESEPSTQDYIEKTIISEVTEIVKQVEEVPAPSDPNISSIEASFGVTSQPVQPQITKVLTPVEQKMRSKAYINSVDARQGHLLVFATGGLSIKKPLLLVEPTRLVYDFPNAILNPALKGKEYFISETDSVRVAQFDSSTVRVVITTSSPHKYRPIFSQNLQSILFSNDDKVANVTLFNTTAKLNNIKMQTINDTTDILSLDFSSPILHSIRNNGNNIEIVLYNTEGITSQQLNNVFYTSRINSIKSNKFSTNGYRIVIPSSQTTKLDVDSSIDGCKLKITMKTPLELINPIPLPSKEITKKQTADESKKVKTVVIDPGHGGSDAGAVRSGVNEKDINLNIAKKLANILTNKGINVEMTHWQDETQSLQGRVDFAQAKKADLFVSVHANASNKEEIHGIETHYYHEYSKEFASVVQKQLIQKTGGHNRGVLQSKFYVINHTTMPAILVETGFISNNNERNALLSEKRQKQTAEAIATGILEFLNKK